MTSISGVMANAVFGALAILFFSTALQHRLENIPLNKDKKNIILTQVSNLGNATVPPALAQQEKEVKKIYRESFIHCLCKDPPYLCRLKFFCRNDDNYFYQEACPFY